MNLLGNALKFTRDRNPACIAVSHHADPLHGHRITIRDNGVGFDAASAGRLFLPFQRLHPAGSFEGHGIGLATVKRIVERHGGHITADAQPGAGATFTVTLPL